jgi:hypothetical protein
MPSIIQTDQLKSADGVTTYLNSGTLSNLTFPSGHVIQTKSVTFYGQQTINNNVFTTIGTGVSGEELTISIAVSSGNKLLISGTVNGGGDQRYSGIILCLDNSGTYTWAETSTSVATGQIFLHTGSGSNTKQAEVLGQFNSNPSLSQYALRLTSVSFQGLYTPSDTSSHTYSLKAGNTYYPSGCNTHINRTNDDGDNSYVQRTISTFTIQEIQQ